MGIADRPGDGRIDELALSTVMEAVEREVRKSVSKHAPMVSPHEGHSVIREEFEELWEHVRADTGRSALATKEAVQLAAMAVRYVMDLSLALPRERRHETEVTNG